MIRDAVNRVQLDNHDIVDRSPSTQLQVPPGRHSPHISIEPSKSQQQPSQQSLQPQSSELRAQLSPTMYSGFGIDLMQIPRTGGDGQGNINDINGIVHGSLSRKISISDSLALIDNSEQTNKVTVLSGAFSSNLTMDSKTKRDRTHTITNILPNMQKKRRNTETRTLGMSAMSVLSPTDPELRYV